MGDSPTAALAGRGSSTGSGGGSGGATDAGSAARVTGSGRTGGAVSGGSYRLAISRSSSTKLWSSQSSCRGSTPAGSGGAAGVGAGAAIAEWGSCSIGSAASTGAVGAGSNAGSSALMAGAEVAMLVSDLSMPGMDGVALIRAAQRMRPGLPAILLTGYAGGVALGAAEGLDGPVSLMGKPVSAAQLADRIATVVERRGAPEV